MILTDWPLSHNALSILYVYNLLLFQNMISVKNLPPTMLFSITPYTDPLLLEIDRCFHKCRGKLLLCMKIPFKYAQAALSV